MSEIIRNLEFGDIINTRSYGEIMFLYYIDKSKSIECIFPDCSTIEHIYLGDNYKKIDSPIIGWDCWNYVLNNVIHNTKYSQSRGLLIKLEFILLTIKNKLLEENNNIEEIKTEENNNIEDKCGEIKTLFDLGSESKFGCVLSTPVFGEVFVYDDTITIYNNKKMIPYIDTIGFIKCDNKYGRIRFKLDEDMEHTIIPLDVDKWIKIFEELCEYNDDKFKFLKEYLET